MKLTPLPLKVVREFDSRLRATTLLKDEDVYDVINLEMDLTYGIPRLLYGPWMMEELLLKKTKEKL